MAEIIPDDTILVKESNMQSGNDVITGSDRLLAQIHGLLAEQKNIFTEEYEGNAKFAFLKADNASKEELDKISSMLINLVENLFTFTQNSLKINREAESSTKDTGRDTSK